jgi:hypothetical protein
MDVAVARAIAHYSHVERRDRLGELVVEHVARVAAAVPAEARALAWLHDVLEHSPTSVAELRGQGLTVVELEALQLLTRMGDESYELYVLRVAFARCEAGRLARIVKLADLDDHIAHPWVPGRPPYEWARRHVEFAVARGRYPSRSPRSRARMTASDRDEASSLR